MHNHTKVLIAALTAIVTFAFAAGVATAHRSIQLLGLEARGGLAASGRLKFGARAELSVSREVVCNVTFLKTITSRVPKLAGTLFGKVTGMAIDRGGNLSEHCRHGASFRGIGDIRPLIGRERPGTHRELGGGVLLWDLSGAEARLWKLIYDSIQGTLPSIEGINFHIQGVQYEAERVLEVITLSCLWEGDVYGLIDVQRETGRAASARVVLERTSLRATRGVGCPEPARFEGSFTVTPALTIELI